MFIEPPHHQGEIAQRSNTIIVCGFYCKKAEGDAVIGA
jgi:hypothetical protein